MKYDTINKNDGGINVKGGDMMKIIRKQLALSLIFLLGSSTTLSALIAAPSVPITP